MPKTTNPFAKKKRPSSSSAASPFSTLQRTKPSAGGLSASRITKHDEIERLDDTGLIPSLAPAGVAQDVVSLWRYIDSGAFADIPDRASGMNSERISEVLRFRRRLPPIVSIAHLHALSRSPTQTERELAKLVAAGAMRKVVVPGRGKGGAAVGEGVVLVEEWVRRVEQDDQLGHELKQKYVHLLTTEPASLTASTAALEQAEIRQLVAIGWLTSPAALTAYDSGTLFASPGTSSLTTLSRAGHTAATGSLAAIGGYGAIQDYGGGGSMLATKESRPSRMSNDASRMTLSLPATGAYLKLLTEARLHLVHQLKQLSPRHKEATLDVLREKWNGNTMNDATSRAKRARGEFAGVLPGKTKRWREFYGLDFEWVLAECVGSGAMEPFDTGSVGLAIRIR